MQYFILYNDGPLHGQWKAEEHVGTHTVIPGRGKYEYVRVLRDRHTDEFGMILAQWVDNYDWWNDEPYTYL